MTDQALRVALAETIDGLILMVPQSHEDTESKTSWQNLRWMLVTALENINLWPTDKASRWIGFVQGVLAVRGILDVDEERNRTRPLFHQAYQAMNVPVPKTQEMQ